MTLAVCHNLHKNGLLLLADFRIQHRIWVRVALMVGFAEISVEGDFGYLRVEEVVQ